MNAKLAPPVETPPSSGDGQGAEAAQPATPSAEKQPATAAAEASTAAPSAAPAGQQANLNPPQPSEEPTAAAASDVAMSTANGAAPAAIGDGFPMSAAPGVSPHAAVAIPSPPPAPAEAANPTTESQSLGAEIAKAVADGAEGAQGPRVAVETTGEGTLISLTDDVDFGMFEIGSAEPQPQTVRIMERIAAILKSRKGKITIRGHTDARPFRNGSYDNWRLSTDRAQFAYYMLVRGGLDESRVAAIEGYADRKLKVPDDPDAAENRRIEILLQEDAQ